MKKIIILFIAVLVCSACLKIKHSRSWTESYYKKMYGYLDTINAATLKDANQRKLFTTYETNRLKAILPDGFSSVSQDSLEKIFAKLGKDYVKTHDVEGLRVVLAWTPENERRMK